MMYNSLDKARSSIGEDVRFSKWREPYKHTSMNGMN
jgi:hypothetical protein